MSYLVVKKQQKKDLVEINRKINEIFQGQNEICDFEESRIQGELIEPNWPTHSFDNEGNAIIEYFASTSGGFNFLKLVRNLNGFELVEEYSTDMGFKIPLSQRTLNRDYRNGLFIPLPPIQLDSSPRIRQTVQSAYSQAMNNILSKRGNNCYKAGSYDRIKTFDELRTKFYTIDNINPTRLSSASQNEKLWWRKDSMIFSDQWVVWYNTEGKHYEIVENKNVFKSKFIKYSILTSIVALFIYLVIRFSKQIEFQTI